MLAFAPIANWIPGGHEAPWYRVLASTWVSGTAIVLGAGAVLAILSGSVPVLWRPRALDGVVAWWTARPVLSTGLLAAFAFTLYAIVAHHVFDGRPLHLDELAQVFQAQIFAQGRLSRPAFAYPEFFSSLHLVDTPGRVYAQFPPGWPALLALGVLAHATWLVAPVCGAIAVAAFATTMRTVEPEAGIGLMASLLFAFAPFTVFLSGSHMNEPATLMWVMLALAAMARTMAGGASQPWLAFLSGLGFGLAATVRPVDALAFAAPAGAWYLIRAIRESRRWRDAIAAALGVALPLALLLWVNRETTGAPLRFGYEVLWGEAHSLGFHAAPWGPPHTPARGLELINLYLLRLQTYLFETPFPSLLPAIAALPLAARLDRFDRYLLVSSGALLGLYFTYWFDGFYLGPRFVYLLLPALALWTARFLPLLRARVGSAWPSRDPSKDPGRAHAGRGAQLLHALRSGALYRMAVYGGLTALLIALAQSIPVRAGQYRQGLLAMRWDADSAAAASGVRDALVLVRESWGAQLVARLWALGVPRSTTERIYLNTDACRLEQAIGALEERGVHGEAAVAALRPLLRDSARTIGSPFSPDTTERLLPGTRYSPRCLTRIAEDRAGFTLFPPLLLAHGGRNVYARDLHERDSLLVRAFPGRPIYLLRPATARVGEPPRFYRVPLDSLERAWHTPLP